MNRVAPKKPSVLQHDRVNEILISIVTVVFNSKELIEKTIQSVIHQSHPNIEYIIIDGGSTDGTQAIVKQYEAHLSHWISESDRGIYDAMNKGIKLAQGQIIGILNSGDLYPPDALTTVAQLYAENLHEFLIITGAMNRFDADTGVEFVQQRSLQDLHRRINLGMPINHPATFVTPGVYQMVGCFNPEFKICGDYDLIYRAYHSQTVKFIFSDRLLACMSMGGMSEKHSHLWVRAREAMRVRQHSINRPLNTIFALRIVVIGYIKYLLTAVAGQKAVLARHILEQKTSNLKNTVNKP